MKIPPSAVKTPRAPSGPAVMVGTGRGSQQRAARAASPIPSHCRQVGARPARDGPEVRQGRPHPPGVGLGGPRPLEELVSGGPLPVGVAAPHERDRDVDVPVGARLGGALRDQDHLDALDALPPPRDGPDRGEDVVHTVAEPGREEETETLQNRPRMVVAARRIVQVIDASAVPDVRRVGQQQTPRVDGDRPEPHAPLGILHEAISSDDAVTVVHLHRSRRWADRTRSRQPGRDQ